jgi:hypothetical protein
VNFSVGVCNSAGSQTPMSVLTPLLANSFYRRAVYARLPTPTQTSRLRVYENRQVTRPKSAGLHSRNYMISRCATRHMGNT